MHLTMRSKVLRDVKTIFALQIKHTNRRAVSTEATSDVKSFKSVPGPSSLPIIGGLHNFLPNGEIGPHMFSKLGDLRAKYGSILKIFQAEETNPTRIGMESLAYYREVYRKDRFRGVYGLSTAQGAQWRDFRTKVNPAMLKPRTIKLYEPGLEEIADDMVAKITKLKDQKEFLHQNFDMEVTKWALESVALVGLGARLGCLRDDLTDDHPGKKLIDCAHSFVDLVFRISTACINEAKKEIASRGHDVPEEDKSIIEKLLGIDEKVAIMMGNEMLLAGIDTVTFTTLHLLYQLATHPEVQEKLRDDIRKGSNRYLRACLKEAMRIKHVAPVNLRQTTKEHIVGGYRIPKGVNIFAPHEYLSNQEIHYPRPNEFLPERWLVNKKDPIYHGNAHTKVKQPFGFGVRSCIGRRIAELEIEIFVRKLIEKLNVSWEGPPAKVNCSILNSMGKPFCINFETID